MITFHMVITLQIDLWVVTMLAVKNILRKLLMISNKVIISKIGLMILLMLLFGVEKVAVMFIVQLI